MSPKRLIDKEVLCVWPSSLCRKVVVVEVLPTQEAKVIWSKTITFINIERVICKEAIVPLSSLFLPWNQK